MEGNNGKDRGKGNGVEIISTEGNSTLSKCKCPVEVDLDDVDLTKEAAALEEKIMG